MAYGIKISKEGIDVGTASGNDLILNSSSNTLKVNSVGTGESTINHNLGYIPPFLSYIDNSLGDQIRLNITTAKSGTATFNNPSSAGGNSMYYFIFYNA